MSYEQGFLDCLDVLERLLIKRGLYTDEIREVVAELRAAVAEKKVESVLFRLGL